MTFKTEDHPKLLFGDDLPKTIKEISETNKVGQSLTQRYQPTLKREMLTKTGKPFLFKSRGYQQREKPRQNVQPYPPYEQRKPKYRFNKNTVMKNTISTYFQIQVSELVHKIKLLNEKSKAGGIYNWKGLTSDKWILKTVGGAHIKIEDLDSVTLSSLSGGNTAKPHRKNFVLNRN